MASDDTFLTARTEARFSDHSRRARVPGACAVAIAFMLGCGAAQAQETNLVLGLSSGVVIRGLLLGRNEPSVQAAATFYGATRWLAGIGAVSLRSPSDDAGAWLITGKVGYVWSLSEDWGAQLDYGRYAYPSSESLRPFDRDELNATFLYRDLVALSVSGLRNARLDDGGSRASVAYDLTGRYPVRPGLSLIAGIGYQDLHRRSGFGYAYGHGGIGVRMGQARFEMSYIMTDATAKAQYGAGASNRWAAGLTWAF
jgi:uncharacterized protein (TIGR02001 family)